jgi:hypothetical protein
MKLKQVFRNSVWLLPMVLVLGFSSAAQCQPVIQTFSGPYSFKMTITQRSATTGAFVKSTKTMTGIAEMYMDADLAQTPNPAGNYMEFRDGLGFLHIAFTHFEQVTTKKNAGNTKQLIGVAAGKFYYNNGTAVLEGPACANITGTVLKDTSAGHLGAAKSITATLNLSGGVFDTAFLSDPNPGLGERVWSGSAKVTLLPIP